ncbi:phospholipase D-like domain-containing protein [Pseudohalioglobus lutimaris]|nr:phospholipase D family protein [Pseudohalioglobus lutimaris]
MPVRPISLTMRATRLCPLLLLWALSLLAGCASPVQRADTGSEPAMARSSDLFWRHLEEDRERDWFYLLNDGGEAMQWRLRMIDSAHQAIDLETFLWSGDEGGLRVFNHLLAAADRGVKVRLLIDDSFTPHEDLALLGIDAHPNIELRVYNPYRHRAGGMTARTLFNLEDFQRVNHRMHNKTLIVDGWAVAVGGRNMADEYFGFHEAYNFRDMEVLAMGDSVATASEHFASFWNSGWSFPAGDVFTGQHELPDLPALRADIAARVGEANVHPEAELAQSWRQLADDAVVGHARFVADAPAHQDPALAAEQPTQFADYVFQSVASASEEVVLVSAYLVPTERLTTAIRDALQRDVKVRILTNSMRSNNHLPAHAAYQGYVRELVVAGVELYELRTDARDRNLYMRAPTDDKKLGLHAKFMLLDGDRVMIGSSNLDPRSLKLNTEVGLMVTSPQLNQRLREAIAVDFLPRNAWAVQLDENQELVWTSDSERLTHPPADSLFQQLEDWFIGLLPIDAEM